MFEGGKPFYFFADICRLEVFAGLVCKKVSVVVELPPVKKRHYATTFTHEIDIENLLETLRALRNKI